MHYDLDAAPQHTGSERYGVRFRLRLGGTDQYDVQGAYVKFKIRPRYVNLVWERHRNGDGYGPWQRRTDSFRGGSKIEGPRVVKNNMTSDKQDGHVGIFYSTSPEDELTGYAASLPGLAELIADVEKELPA